MKTDLVTDLLKKHLRQCNDELEKPHFGSTYLKQRQEQAAEFKKQIEYALKKLKSK